MINRIVSFFILCLVLCIPLCVAYFHSGELMMRFVFFWPFFMSILWIVGGFYFWAYRERHWPWGENAPAPQLKDNPSISIIIPCFNEEKNVEETIHAALAQRYENIEVIAVNDGSTDKTRAILDQLAAEIPRLRVIHLAQNQGKAIALKTGAAAAKSEYLVCIDGDALLDRDAAAYIVEPMLYNPRVGAVTGNPRIRTRSTLIGKIQVGEFSSIIGLIKRTQRIYGNVFTVSGVIAAFRRSALAEVGYWSDDMITEDIDISWKLQLNQWTIFYEPRALCWILMPETLKGLWKQRLRWAQGGAEVFLKNMTRLWRKENVRMWPLFFEYCLTTIWAFTCLVGFIIYVVQLAGVPLNIELTHIAETHTAGILLCALCLVQFIVSLVIENRYEHNLASSLLWIIWFPVIFWVLSLATTLVSFTRVMLMHKKQRARWISPDRGILRG
ncbi:poly-beta-1,6-N-acetyl-D-glucosamine synthase [Escherichia coli]|nr:poly-beta-1,6 N-acetyl-D-glucosamine synthase [Escherichia coli]EFH8552444.1 poly-beta-1,6 N-acetyl-D-glucosamine synthase [Escherichia coli]EFL4033019.1 poly-beta-1,6 N-acetyl-D-glucosamine synthase [Escherichia coli]EFM2059362.1 poly-beta-1,6 N-acetyl-D-glucosamine synthase [Escherichia coli]EFT0764308.1 poly-beta-1,6 N-acetyl-D-glucosamine synthase [Escherichia coli]